MTGDRPEDVILMTIKVRGTSRRDFVVRYCNDVVRGGMVLRTGQSEPPPLGTRVRFRFRLEDGQEVFCGEGQVSWVKRGSPPCIGMRFECLDPGSDELLAEMLTTKERIRTGEFEEVAPTQPVPRVLPAVRLRN
jgi:uncharacterized protein (TIGR02266 family)